MVGQATSLLCGVLLNIWFILRLRQRALNGGFRKGGGQPYKLRKLATLLNGLPITGLGAGVLGWGLVFSRVAPAKVSPPFIFLIIAVPLLQVALFALLGFITSRYLMYLYLYKRFDYKLTLKNEEKNA
jgi:hypothetical protein